MKRILHLTLYALLSTALALSITLPQRVMAAEDAPAYARGKTAASVAKKSSSVAVPDGEAPSMASSDDDIQKQPPGSSPEEAPPTFLEILYGTWEGNVVFKDTKGKETPYKVAMHFTGEPPVQNLVVSVEALNIRNMEPNGWSNTNDMLRFSLFEGERLSELTLYAQSENTLTGACKQGDQSQPVTFEKVSDVTLSDGYESFVFEGASQEEWLKRLQQYPSYQDDKTQIPFTYELYRWDKSLPLINGYNLGAAVGGKSDIDTMIILLNTVCDNFRHDGMSGMPEQLDAMSVISYYSQRGGIECRGLAIILSEMLRTCGIPAKPVMCIPSIEPSQDCHVVVHAYSKSLGQWVMLDPTYRLILKDGAGKYVSLPMLRESLISGAPLTANENAGHNGTAFNMAFYRAYMTKNTFRFSCATNYAFGAENAAGNRTHMLVPKGYPVPYAYSRPELVTTSAQAFWAAPTF